MCIREGIGLTDLDWKFAEGGELKGGNLLEVDGGGIEYLLEIEDGGGLEELNDCMGPNEDD